MEAEKSAIPEIHLPELIVFEPKARDIVIGSIKLVLRHLSKAGALQFDGEYTDLLKNPEALFEFIQWFRENRDVAHDLAVNSVGKPVADDQTPLICKLTLAQIERLLVYTCAKKRLAYLNAQKDGQAEQRTTADLSDEIKDVMGFSWQLPLLDIYLNVMTPDHFRVLGWRVLVLRSVETLEPIARLDAHALRQAEKTMGSDFDKALQHRPVAIRGAAACPPKAYANIKKAAKKSFWNTLSASPEVVLEIAAMSYARIAAVAPFAEMLCAEACEQFEAVPESVLPVMLESFGSVFEELAPNLLGEPAFAEKFLFKMVGGLRSMKIVNSQQQAASMQAIGYKWQGEQKEILDWWAKRPRR